MPPAAGAGRGRPAAGSVPRPLSPSFGAAADLGAAQGRERFAGRAAGVTGAPQEPVLLELPVRSYTLPEETEEERERKRQTEMLRTMERFAYPEGAPGRAAGEGAPAPEEELPKEEEEAAPGAPETAALPEEELRAAERDAMRLQRQQQRSRLAEAAQMAEMARRGAGTGKLENLKRLQNLWRMAAGAEAAGSETVVGLVLLVLQLNLQVINKWIFPKTELIPPTSFPEDAATVCLDGACCCVQFAPCVILVIFFSLIAAASANKWAAFTTGIGALFMGIFSGVFRRVREESI